MSPERTRPDVTLVAPYPGLGVRHGGHSGVASYTANLAGALAAQGAAVTVVAPVQPGEPAVAADGGVTVRREFNLGHNAMHQAMTAARATGAGVVHVQHELLLYGGPLGIPATMASLATAKGARRTRGTGQRLVVTMHQVVSPADVTARYTRMHRIGVPAPVARLAITAVQRAIPALADAVVVHEPSFADTVPGAVTVPHGVEIADLVPESDRKRVRADLGVADHELLAMCFGFIAPYKGLETAGDAARELAARGASARLVIAGGPHPRLESRHHYAHDLEQRYGDIARFTGYVADKDIAPLFAAADVAVLPYPAPHASSGPLALAVAFCTPVLASSRLAQTCGLPEAAAFDGSAQLADRLDALSASASARAQLSAALAPMRAARAWPEVARQHVKIYQEVAG